MLDAVQGLEDAAVGVGSSGPCRKEGGLKEFCNPEF